MQNTNDRLLHKASIIAQDFLFSRFCYLCAQKRATLFPICKSCLYNMEKCSSHCRCCGQTLPENNICGQCIKTPAVIQYTFPAYHYEGLMRELVLQLKQPHGLPLIRPASQLLIRSLKHKKHLIMPDALIAVPCHKSKIRQRGFNQSLELSKIIAKELKIPNLSLLAKKVRKTADQASLPLSKRKRNLLNCFHVNSKALPNHIAIIDDVMTTGFTANELAHCLKQAGAKKVDLWCLARSELTQI